MKNYYYLWLLSIMALFPGCTDIVNIEVPEEIPRLVIEASMDWTKGSLGNRQEVKLSLSTPYFEGTTASPVTGASVKVIRDNDKKEILFTDQNNGIYKTDDFDPVLEESYTLEVIYDGEIYLASETMMPVTDISSVYQSRENGFDKNALEVNIEFNDPENVENFYLTKFQRRGDLLPSLFDVKDEFTDGNLMTVFYEKLDNENTGEKEFEPGDIVDISLYGLSEQYYNYIKLLIEQSGEVGGPFTTIPAEIKGNCFNVSNPDNYAYGYFRLTEVDRRVFNFE